jgi:hypothetical protein
MHQRSETLPSAGGGSRARRPLNPGWRRMRSPRTGTTSSAQRVETPERPRASAFRLGHRMLTHRGRRSYVRRQNPGSHDALSVPSWWQTLCFWTHRTPRSRYSRSTERYPCTLDTARRTWARALENRCARKSTGGSNPPLSVGSPAENPRRLPARSGGIRTREGASVRETVPLDCRAASGPSRTGGEARTAACDARCVESPLSAPAMGFVHCSPVDEAGFSRLLGEFRWQVDGKLDDAHACQVDGTARYLHSGDQTEWRSRRGLGTAKRVQQCAIPPVRR